MKFSYLYDNKITTFLLFCIFAYLYFLYLFKLNFKIAKFRYFGTHICKKYIFARHTYLQLDQVCKIVIFAFYYIFKFLIIIFAQYTDLHFKNLTIYIWRMWLGQIVKSGLDVLYFVIFCIL